MYALVFATRAKKALKKHGRSGRFPKKRFERALASLCKSGSLPVSYRDHQLPGDLSQYREFHLADDLLVQYKRNEEHKLITIARVGTHTELFGT